MKTRKTDRGAVGSGILLCDGRPSLPCRSCNASGRVKMPDELWRLLVTLREARGPLTTDEMPLEGCGSTGLNNRLTTLEVLGLVERRGKRSKSVLWAACSHSPSVSHGGPAHD